MGTKLQESNQAQQGRSSTRTGAVSDRESNLQQLLMELAGTTSQQFGDISGIAAGDMLDMPDNVREDIDRLFSEQAQISRRQAEMDYRDLMTNTQDYFAKRGQTDSSMERGGVRRTNAEFFKRLQDIESERASGVAGANLEMPLKTSDLQLRANQVLSGMVSGFSSPLLSSWLQTRLANVDQTSSGTSSGMAETSGYTVGELASLLSGVGAIKKAF